MEKKRSSTETITNVVDNSNLKPFVGNIEVIVSVQAIYERLLNEFPEDYKHRELVAHAIIGSLNNIGNLSYTYNALNGFSNEIDFKVGDAVMCSTEKRYVLVVGKDEKKRVQIGQCIITGVNLYSTEKLRVKFFGHDYYGSSQERDIEVWVDHTTCSKVPPTDEQQAEVQEIKSNDSDEMPFTVGS